MNLLKKLEWRYATKSFDPNRIVSETNIEVIKRAIQLSTSSYGLQLYKVIIVTDPEIRKQLRLASYNQAQITESSHLFIFCNYLTIESAHIDDYIARLSSAKEIAKEALEGYGSLIKEKIFSMESFNLNLWLEKQTYLALGNLLNACAELEIDACPMEGFNSNSFNKILGLEKQQLNSCVLAAVGYRSQEDKNQFVKKVRKPLDELFELI